MKYLARFTLLAVSLCFLKPDLTTATAAAPEKPNIVFILADDLGYGDLGCYGQKKIKTPRIDQMAAEGMKFSQMYAGCTVCAPSRCVLMTGLHMGHCRVRGNTRVKENQSLKPEDVTVAEILKQAGYKTALTGKWGVGEEGTQGLPNLQGFDYFYGYLNQHNAHNYYPGFLWKNDKKVSLNNIVDPATINSDGLGGVATKKVDYSHDLVMQEALDFIDRSAQDPFFLYVALTIPHANNEAGRKVGDGQEVPDYGIYENTDWQKQNKGQAAMVTRMDTGVGQILDKLKALNIDKKTLVIFSSDNGHHREGGNDPEFFDANGPLRGMKRDLYEGGIRVPLLIDWPGRTRPGTVCHTPVTSQDFAPTFAESFQWLQAALPADGESLLPLLSDPEQALARDTLYWHFPHYYPRMTPASALRYRNWKLIHYYEGNRHELYDLQADVGESRDLAPARTDVVTDLRRRLDAWREALGANQPMARTP
ncbi:MAG: arylsulfatase [Planctomycetaceae bacterium]|nr:arylsulfatase [Planctomycetaceae bacterium]